MFIAYYIKSFIISYIIKNIISTIKICKLLVENYYYFSILYRLISFLTIILNQFY